MGKRFAISLLLSLAACMAFAGGGQEAPQPDASRSTPSKSAGGYSEAPMLAEMVRSGRLPSIDERLPEEPFVLPPYETTGEHGGTFRVYAPGVDSFADMHWTRITDWLRE